MTTATKPAVVYRLYDDAGELLYVGCSVTPFSRLREHASHGRSHVWWADVASVTLEHFKSRPEAILAERKAIAAEAPKYNVYSGGPVARTRARAARVEKATSLRAEGLKLREIASEMGVAISTVDGWLNDPLGERLATRKRSYGGTCEDCGRPTDGSNGRDKAPTRCRGCEVAAREHNKVWTREVLLSRIREWAVEYGEPPAIPDWSPSQARQLGNEARARRFESANGRWPWPEAVIREFGSWNAAIEAAGFVPRANTGGGGNELRKRALHNVEVAA